MSEAATSFRDGGNRTTTLPFSTDPTNVESFRALTTQRQLCPEKQLMLAVLWHAIDELRKPLADANNSVGRAQETRDWFHQGYPDWPFSYTAICDALGIEPIGLRDALFRELTPLPVIAGPVAVVDGEPHEKTYQRVLRVLERHDTSMRVGEIRGVLGGSVSGSAIANALAYCRDLGRVRYVGGGAWALVRKH